MVLVRVRLFQFRCHRELEWRMGPGRNFLLGANGRGKTSVLEAIFYLSRLRSWRTSQAREMTTWGTDCFRIEADGGSQTLRATWRPEGRTLEWNGQPLRDAAEFWGRLPTVLMVSDDRELVRGPGSVRRNWADSLIAQRDPAFLRIAQRFHRALKQRNAWLKDGAIDSQLGASLTRLVTEHGTAVTLARQFLTADLADAVSLAYREISGNAEPLAVSYRPSFPHDGSTPNWPSVEREERRLQSTLIGPHRDDWRMELGGRAIARYGSEGQQRTAALALRLAEARLIFAKRGEFPILLMDDVTPQLDESRQSALRDHLPTEAQVIITSPDDRGWAQAGDSRWHVEAGRVGVTELT
jgi:DNA replication and repair protein RecF